MPNGPMRITSAPFDPQCYKSEYKVQDEKLQVTVPVYLKNINSQQNK